MKIKCDYCGNNINSTDDVCPHCGAPNAHVERAAQGVPTSIEELSAYFQKNGISEEQTRFFIGKDTQQAKAFGIFKDENGVVTVYKNKSDGSRAVRYQGTDEAYAVNEIYQKFVEERSKQIAAGNVTPRSSQRSNSGSHGTSGNHSSRNKKRKGFFGHLFTPSGTLFLIIFIMIMIYAVHGAISSSNSGYGTYHSTPYYYDVGDYDTYGGYDYYDDGYSYDDYDDYSGSYWDNDSSWDSDWDYDYDYDSWDSGWDSDWDSDW